ncbi:MAG: tetratricopeptide repeat protein [Clostridiales bacterium]
MKKLNLSIVLKYIPFVVLYVISTSLRAQTIDEGLKLLEVEKYNAARKVFEDYVSKNSKKPEGYFNLGKLDVIEGKLDAAQETFQKGKSTDEDDATNIIGLGMVKLAKGDTAGAWKDFEEALDKTDKKNVDNLIYIAESYVLTDAKNYNRAIDLLNKAANKSKKNSRVYATLGDIYMKQSNGSQAISNYRTAIDYDKKYLKAYVGIAQIYIKIKNYEDAEYNIEKALKADSTYAPAYRVLAEYYYGKKQYEKGSENFRKYVQFSENTPDKQVRFATMLFLSNEYDEAIKLINQLASEGKNNDKLQHILAFCYFYKDNPTDGVPAFEKYFSMAKPNDISATDYEYLGKLYAKGGNDSLAVQSYKKAISMDSTRSGDLYGEMATMDMKNKNWAAAADDFRKKEALTGKKLGAMEYFNLGQAYYKMNDFAKADSAFDQFIQQQPTIAQGYYWRALCNAQLDPESEKGLAKPFYEKYIQIATASPDPAKVKGGLIEAYSYLGYYYYLQNDYQNSIANWTEVSKLDPGNTQASEALKALKDPKSLKAQKDKKPTKK